MDSTPWQRHQSECGFPLKDEPDFGFCARCGWINGYTWAVRSEHGLVVSKNSDTTPSSENPCQIWPGRPR